jgi:hypothetical protein
MGRALHWQDRRMLQPNKATQARHADPGRHRARLRASVAGRSSKRKPFAQQNQGGADQS